jgi:adenosine deaminase
MDKKTFICGLPKAELHIHIEGSLEPEMMVQMAQRNHVAIPYADAAAARAAYSFGNLQNFLDLYYQGASVLRTEEDFHDLASAYYTRAAADNVSHAEIFFDPQTHTGRGVPLAVVMRGLLSAKAAAHATYGITSGLILCFLRHLSEDEAFNTLKQAEPWLEDIIGVGLDSTEIGYLPQKFARVFADAGERGLRRVAHAGEEGPPQSVSDTLDYLHVDRIDHGIRALEDDELIARLARQQTTLTVCPLSNLKLQVVQDIAQHPIKRMLDLGLAATINSDDPAYFGGYLNENFYAVAPALSLKDIATLARNSFRGSFLPEGEVARRLEEVDAYIAGQSLALFPTLSGAAELHKRGT